MTFTYNELRKKHPLFIYHSYEFSEGKLKFHFSIDEYHFYPEWSFDPALAKENYNHEQADKIAFSLGMAELVSYWKCSCSPKVEIRCGALSDWQKNWWKKLYFNGLGEFFYRNNIDADFDDFMTIAAPLPGKTEEYTPALSGALVPVGGGKDSVVTLELLKKAGCDITPYIINPRKSTLGCAEAAVIPQGKEISPHRTIDKTLLELNKQGYLNGHTPFSAVVAFSSMLFACFTNKKYIVLSNESSANETYVDGKNVNHQYSKSTEFEVDFREYCEKSFGKCPEYFSLLRPLSEFQIAKEFVKYPAYFKVFLSCNLGSKTDSWCCNCAKCLYVYILLAAFLEDNVLEEIFGCNMLEKTEFSGMLDGLMLEGEDKPFECVGTKSEVRLALKMACDLRRKTGLPPLLKRFEEHFPDYVPVNLDHYFDRNSFVPQEFLPLLESITNEN